METPKKHMFYHFYLPETNLSGLESTGEACVCIDFFIQGRKELLGNSGHQQEISNG